MAGANCKNATDGDIYTFFPAGLASSGGTKTGRMALALSSPMKCSGIKIWKHSQSGTNGVKSFSVEAAASTPGSYKSVGTFTPGSGTGYFTYTFNATTSKHWGFNIKSNSGNSAFTSARFIQLDCEIGFEPLSNPVQPCAEVVDADAAHTTPNLLRLHSSGGYGRVVFDMGSSVSVTALQLGPVPYGSTKSGLASVLARGQVRSFTLETSTDTDKWSTVQAFTPHSLWKGWAKLLQPTVLPLRQPVTARYFAFKVTGVHNTPLWAELPSVRMAVTPATLSADMRQGFLRGNATAKLSAAFVEWPSHDGYCGADWSPPWKTASSPLHSYDHFEPGDAGLGACQAACLAEPGCTGFSLLGGGQQRRDSTNTASAGHADCRLCMRTFPADMAWAGVPLSRTSHGTFNAYRTYQRPKAKAPSAAALPAAEYSRFGSNKCKNGGSGLSLQLGKQVTWPSCARLARAAFLRGDCDRWFMVDKDGSSATCGCHKAGQGACVPAKGGAKQHLFQLEVRADPPPCGKVITAVVMSSAQDLCVPGSGGRVKYTGRTCGHNQIEWTSAQALDVRAGKTRAKCAFNWLKDSRRASLAGGCGQSGNASGANMLPTFCTPATPADELILGRPGANSCPAGYSVVGSAADCEASARAARPSGQSPKRSHQQGKARPDAPPFCSVQTGGAGGGGDWASHWNPDMRGWNDGTFALVCRRGVELAADARSEPSTFCPKGAELTCSDGDVRAVDSKGSSLSSLNPTGAATVELRPRVLHGGAWHPVCGKHFWDNNARALAPYSNVNVIQRGVLQLVC